MGKPSETKQGTLVCPYGYAMEGCWRWEQAAAQEGMREARDFVERAYAAEDRVVVLPHPYFSVKSPCGIPRVEFRSDEFFGILPRCIVVVGVCLEPKLP